MESSVRVDDVVVSFAYAWIPLQLILAFARHPELASMPPQVFRLTFLVCLFFILCSGGHFLRAIHYQGGYYDVLNGLTALVSILASLLSFNLVPTLVRSLDKSLKDVIKLNEETAESKQKSLTFMSFLCHEIRNPLFAITSAITFLGEDSLTESQESTVETISESAELMLRLVNDVLDINKLESGKLQIERRKFDLQSLLAGAIATADTQIKQAHGQGVQLRVQVSSRVPRRVYSDSARLLQIVYNLLNNANKFTDKGYIAFDVSVCDFEEAVESRNVSVDVDDSSSQDNGDGTADFSARLLDSEEEGRSDQGHNRRNTVVLRFSVSDTGIGISPKRVSGIFKPYSQAKMSDYRKHGGTGLGLSIVSKLTRIMGGSIEVNSKEMEGSIFTVHLPLQICVDEPHDFEPDSQMKHTLQNEPDLLDIQKLCSCRSGSSLLHTNDYINSAAPAAVDPLSSAPERRKLSMSKKLSKPLTIMPGSSKVLVVDDNHMNRKLLGRMLSNFNVECEMASNGKEALEIILMSRNATGDLSASLFGLVLMDMQMPVMDGCESIERLRQRNIDVPVIALTANALDEWKKKALEAGATEFATKPILRDDLFEKCCKYLRQGSS